MTSRPARDYRFLPYVLWGVAAAILVPFDFVFAKNWGVYAFEAAVGVGLIIIMAIGITAKNHKSSSSSTK